MNVRDLIKALTAMPEDAEVLHLWDGACGTIIQNVWLARDGTVVTSDYSEVCYSTESRPATAPTAEEDYYWKSPDDPNE